jgi:hypothetical protein
LSINPRFRQLHNSINSVTNKYLNKSLSITNAYGIAMQSKRVRGERTGPAGKHAPLWVSLADGLDHRPVARVNACNKKNVSFIRISQNTSAARNIPS